MFYNLKNKIKAKSVIKPIEVKKRISRFLNMQLFLTAMGGGGISEG